jgi:hypothetical protein
MREDTGLAGIDRLAQHYTGRPYPQRDRGRVSAWIAVDRWYGWGALKETASRAKAGPGYPQNTGSLATASA